MKNKIKFLIVLLCTNFLLAQNVELQKKKELQNKADLTDIFITDDLSIHFRSPEPIQYVDISSNAVIGDLPVENILRIKFSSDSLSTGKNYSEGEIAIITVVGQSYMAQYKLNYTADKSFKDLISEVEIIPKEMKPLEFPNVSLTKNELRDYSYELLKRKPSYKSVTSKSFGLIAALNNIYSYGDFIFIDISYKNETNIKYDFNEVRFKIEDKRIFKATNVQELEVKPEFTLYKNKSFRKEFRNIYVFKKFTYPNSKVLAIQLNEQQISGRMIDLKIDYKDLLNADTF